MVDVYDPELAVCLVVFLCLVVFQPRLSRAGRLLHQKADSFGPSQGIVAKGAEWIPEYRLATHSSSDPR